MEHPGFILAELLASIAASDISQVWLGWLPTWVNWQNAFEGRSRKCSIKNLLRRTDRASEWAPIYGWRHNKESSQCSSEASESKMNSFYEADFTSVMVLAQSSQQRAAVKGELWQDSGTKRESTFTWLNAGRSPAQLFLMAMHWQEGRLFLIVCTSFRHAHKTPLSPSFVTNLRWPAFKTASGVFCTKEPGRQGYRDVCSWMSSPEPGISH